MIRIKKSQIILVAVLCLVLVLLCVFQIPIPSKHQAYAQLRQEAKYLFEGYCKKDGGEAVEANAKVETEGETRKSGKLKGETSQRKIAYLTFDDGPSKYTETILDILKENQACATFFLIGGQVNEENKEILLRLLEEGNDIGIHTFSHESDIYSSKKQYLEDFYQTRDLIQEELSVEPKLYRFPWGSTNRYLKPFKTEVVDLLEQEGYVYEDWNVSAEDSVGHPSVNEIIRNIKKDLTRFREPVILMHDSSINENTVRALPEIIQWIRSEGYEFGVLENRETPCQY